MIKQEGFTLVEGLLIVLILSVVGFAGYTVWNNSQEEEAESVVSVNQGAEKPVDSEEEKQESTTPDDWAEYTNTDFGFSFAYPSEWGEVTASEPHYGSEQQAGPRISLSFTDCEGCDPDKSLPLGASTPEIAINSRDFGGVGTSRPLASDAGYIVNRKGDYTVYKWAGKETIYTSANTLELEVIGEVLFIRQNDSFHGFDTTRAIINISDSSYSGISFIIHDTVGETSNSELLKSIVKTFTLN